MAKKEKKIYGPCSEKQKIILQDNTTDIIFMGGGAGGGKSRICLTKNLDGINDPNFRCVILRRYEPELKKPGGIIDESKKIYPDFTKIPYKTQAKLWEFGSGATIAFSAISCDDDLGSWQGAQLTRAVIDEVCDRWTEKQVLFLLSRLRSESKMHHQLILTGNPDINSFMKKWVDFCLDPDTGVPVPGTENRIRWMYVENNEVKWADSAQESFELYGKPKGMIFALGMSDEEIKKYPPEMLFMPKSFRFVPTGVMDNPYLLPPKNNSYLANLKAQPYVNQLRFLHGSWTAREAEAGFFKREWCEIVDHPPNVVTARVRAWDFAASEPNPHSSNNANIDWSVGVKMSRDKFGTYYVEDVIRFQARTDKVLKTVAKTAHEDGTDACEVCIPVDPAAAGKTAALFYISVLAENGVGAKTKKTSGHSSKLTRFKPLCAIAENGGLKIVRGDWNEAFFAELEAFEENNRKQKDDQVDAASDAFAMLARQTALPTFTIPTFTQPSPIPTI